MSQPERIFHIATHADWVRARETGTYTTSTVGRTLADEGFIHACRSDQLARVFDRHYRDVGEHLVLLSIAPDRLEAEVRDEPVGDEVYPHVYGPLTPDSVVEVQPLDRRGRPATFFNLFLGGMFVRMSAVLAVMVLGIAGLAVASLWTSSPTVQLVALVVAMIVGAAAIGLIARRRR